MSTGRGTADWMSSYSDAVFAVIVTIMVLQLKPPESTRFSALFDLWPTAISYVVSYVFVAIIWINHHNLTRFLGNPSLGLIWVNFSTCSWCPCCLSRRRGWPRRSWPLSP